MSTSSVDRIWERLQVGGRHVDWITLIFCAIAPIYPLQWTVAYDMAWAVYIAYGHWPSPDSPDPKLVPPHVYADLWYIDAAKLALYVLITFCLYRVTNRIPSLKRRLLAFCYIPFGVFLAYLIFALDIGGVYQWVFD